MPKHTVKLLQGNEAFCEGAILAGIRFFAGYPITPSSEIAEEMSRKLPLLGGKFIQMEDEIASMGAIIGASLTGLKSMTATSGPGFSLKQENIGYASFTEIPCIIINIQRGGPSTGLPTYVSQADMMQAKWGSHGDYPIIAVCPSSVQECITFTILAVNLSEKYRVPVIILSDEVIGHMREKVEIPLPEEIELIERKRPTCPPEEYKPFDDVPDYIPPLANFGKGYRFHVTGLTHDEWGNPAMDPVSTHKLLTRLKNKIAKNLEDICKYEALFCEDAETIVVAYGISYRVAKSAVLKARKQGIKVGLFKLITIWPFPNIQFKRICAKAKKFIVPELNQGQMIGEVMKYAPKDAEIIGVNKYDGTILEPDEIYKAII